jgi:hypothetical protein
MINHSSSHTFHIPVMGLAYTIDTPVKVARFGISSVVSIIEDHLVERMRELYCNKEGLPYVPIKTNDEDHRARRITAYLDLLNRIVKEQVEQLRHEPFEKGNDIVKYFEMLPDSSSLKKLYKEMLKQSNDDERAALQKQLRDKITAGSIDVNVMTKLDRPNYSPAGEKLPVEYCDAMAALRGFANSTLSSSMVFSAGLNPRLYSYCESFPDFLPDENGHLVKKIILKVSDYRSAMIQGKFLAKKGLWISEFRIESGLNCGGHAFPTDGLLLGPILEEFKLKRGELYNELLQICNAALTAKGKNAFSNPPELKITVQGGIGTAEENKFMLDYYNLDGTGWGSPFLLVPETTNVDDDTLKQLATAKKEDYFLSNASPLGMPFSNFRKSSSEHQRKKRIEKGRPGSPCYLKFLSFDTEFTAEPICTSSREYQNLKIKQLKESHLATEVLEAEVERLTERDCLCEGLGVSAMLKNHLTPPHNLKAVTICPGPNLAYFSGVFSLQQMIDHIYGRANILNDQPRPHMFMNELQLYIDYLKQEIEKSVKSLAQVRDKTGYFNSFRENLLKGIEYYKALIPSMKLEAKQLLDKMQNDLSSFELALNSLELQPVQQ